MLVYHTSAVRVAQPDVYHSREFLDFGKGFSVTTMRDQAVRYGERFQMRGKSAFLSTYELDADSLADFKVKRFPAYDNEWLGFVLKCRKGLPVGDYDVVIGGVADDRVFRTVELFFSGEMSKSEALRRLIHLHPNNQICFRRQKAIDLCLHYIGTELLPWKNKTR